MPVSATSRYRIAEISSEWDDLASENPFLRRSNLAVLEETNPCDQQYHILQQAHNRVAVVTYRHRLNCLTLGRGHLPLPVTIVGIPCSVSRCGYAPSTAQWLLEKWIPSIKGITVVLNADESLHFQDTACHWTLPSCYLDIHWSSTSEYVASMRSPYRRRLNRALAAWHGVNVRQLNTPQQFDETLHALYRQVYKRSAFKLECLDIEFFRCYRSTLHVCRAEGQAIAFFQTVGNDEELIFMFGGMDYAQRDRYDIYINLLFEIIRYAIRQGYTHLDLGQTAEEAKLRLGCRLIPKRFVAAHSNRYVNWLMKKSSGLLAYRMPMSGHTVFRGDQ
jgi:hypothetical protein